MQIIADLHTHTNVTDHAFSTLTEMVQAAHDMGLKAIAITNHGPTNPDGPHEWHFSNLNLVPRKMNGVTVIRGIEFDITAPSGGINVMANKSLKHIDWALASFHECLFPPADRSIHTAALESILYNPYVNAFGHLGNPNFDFDHEYIISRCNERGKVVEINNASLNVRAGSKKNCADIARMCMKYEVPIAYLSMPSRSAAMSRVRSKCSRRSDSPRSSSSTAAWRVWTLTSRAAAWICSAAKNKRGTYADRY